VSYGAVDRYFEELLVGRDAVLDEVLERSEKAGLPPHHVSPLLGKLLHLIASFQGARTILEIGTLGGYSAIWLARALPEGGRLVTIEVDPKRANLARANLSAAGVASAVEVRVGRAIDVLEDLRKEAREPFDLVFVDADKANSAEYVSRALDLCREGSAIILDNVVRGGAVIDAACEDPSVAGIRRMTELVAREPRLVATAIQTVSVKGHDGFAIARVRSACPPPSHL
jgi:predicted O-methyltransferase YrrM